MCQKIYTQLLSTVEQDLHGFILEEDKDSGHKGVMATRWKKKHGIQYYLNAPKSPDLSPIENVDKERAKQRILDMFEHKIEQEWINNKEAAGLLISRWCPYGV